MPLDNSDANNLQTTTRHSDSDRDGDVVGDGVQVGAGRTGTVGGRMSRDKAEKLNDNSLASLAWLGLLAWLTGL